MNDINKMIKSNETYLYLRISNILDNYRYKKEQLYQRINSESYLIYKYLDILKNYDANNQIKIEKNETNIEFVINRYFDAIIKSLENEKSYLKLTHVKILKNLLASKKSLEILKYSKNLSSNKIFTIKDFLFYYSFIAMEKLFVDKNGEFEQKDSDDLNIQYLYFIFQINDTEDLKKLKYCIYNYLYEKKDINEFINKSFEEINSKGNIRDTDLRVFEMKYNELNLSINKIHGDMISLIGEDLKKNDSDLLKFFNITTIQSNYNNSISEKSPIIEDKIVIDELNYKNNKIHLFTPRFLIINGLISKYKEDDFEIFNEGNYSVDLFTKFLHNVIDEFNQSVKENKKNDFITKHQVKFHKYKKSHHMSSKLDFNDKNNLKNMNKQVTDKNHFIKIKIYKDKKDKKVKKENSYNNNGNNISNNNNDLLNQKKNDKNTNSDSLSKSKITSNSSMSEAIKYQSDNFEKLINNKMQENAKNETLKALPNISFKLNLKIPIYNKQNNSINYESVHLDYCDIKEENKNKNLINSSKNDKNEINIESENIINNSEKNKNNKNDINFTGFKEIDSVFQNSSDNSIFVGDLEYFHVNFKFIKGNKKEEFEIKETKNEEKFNIYSNSIIFCEIKNSFPNTSRGRKKYFNMKIIKPKASENFMINNDLEGLEPYCEELDKLIRKFFFFFDVYKKDNKKIPNNIQIVLLYDRFNVDQIDPNFIEIKDATKKILNYYKNKFKNKGNIIFQLIFFDYIKFSDDKEKEVRKQREQLKEKNNELIEKKNELQEKNEIIKNKEKQLKEKEKEMKKFNDKIKELNQKNDLSPEEKWNLLSEFLKTKGAEV